MVPEFQQLTRFGESPFFSDSGEKTNRKTVHLKQKKGHQSVAAQRYQTRVVSPTGATEI